MRVTINGKKTTLDKKNVIGVGGEATVFKHNNQAVKIYLSPDPQRDKKVRAMTALSRSLPPEIIAPQQPVFDEKGQQVIGFTMRLVESDFLEVRYIATKKYRAKSGLTGRDVAGLFLNTHRSLRMIHNAGMVIGDLNDLNLMFRDDEMLFVDVDSFQFDQFPCVVATEAFLDPALYGCDLSQGAFFMPDHDWYAFAVHLFKSLLLTHPYGGVHPKVNLLTQRAQRKITVFDSDVKYPRIAYNPELLSDDLLHEFGQWFGKGKRGIFPETAIHDYMAKLNTCPSCSATYPRSRAHCPMCSTIVPVMPLPMSQIQTLLETGGEIVAYHVRGEEIRLVTHEGSKAVYYAFNGKQPVRKSTLFDAVPNATYAFLDEMLVISPGLGHTSLMMVDVSGNKPQPVLQTTTGIYDNTTPIFGANGRSFYRLAAGYLMKGYVEYDKLIEQPVMSIAENQTWLQVAPDAEKVYGFFRTFNSYSHWLLIDDAHVNAQVTPLDSGEFLIETGAKFDKQSVLVMRRTQLHGVERIHVDELDNNGYLLNSFVTTQVDLFPTLDGHAYARGVLLYATVDGITQERLDTRTTRTFKQTEPVTRFSNAILPYRKGLALLMDNKVMYVTM